MIRTFVPRLLVPLPLKALLLTYDVSYAFVNKTKQNISQKI